MCTYFWSAGCRCPFRPGKAAPRLPSTIASKRVSRVRTHEDVLPPPARTNGNHRTPIFLENYPGNLIDYILIYKSS